MTKRLYIFRGLPGSGKTTRARLLQTQIGARLVGRDHIRPLVGVLNGVGTAKQEQRVTREQERLIREGLRLSEPVIVDDMNLRAKYVRRLKTIAHEEGTDCFVIDLTDTPVDVCVRRDAARDRQVGELVIRDLHRRFIMGRGGPLPVPELDTNTVTPSGLYVPPEGAPQAWIVDIDGTVAKMDGRGPHEYHRVAEDRPNVSVITVVRALVNRGYKVLFVSGRPDSCRVDTRQWLNRYVTVVRDDELLMRATGDHRPDDVIKQGIFDREIRTRYHVVGVIDDRQRVVDMWRGLGLTVLQADYGDF